MPNIQSAIKRMRSNEKKRQRNLSVRSEVKTVLKKVKGAVANKDADAAKILLQAAYSELDKAAKKNVIHQNKADRSKARMAKKVEALLKSQQ